MYARLGACSPAQALKDTRKNQSYSELDRYFDQWKVGIDSYEKILSRWKIEKEEVDTLRSVVKQQVPIWYSEENICIPHISGSGYDRGLQPWDDTQYFSCIDEAVNMSKEHDIIIVRGGEYTGEEIEIE